MGEEKKKSGENVRARALKERLGKFGRSLKSARNTVKVELREPKKAAQKKPFSAMFAKKQLPQTPTALFNKLPLDAQTTETYDIVSPFSKVTIASLKELGGGKAYYIDEIEPAENEIEPLRTLLEIISKELEPPKNGVDPKSHVEAEARR